MQYGIFVLRFDVKGRIVIPAALREHLGSESVFASNMVIYTDAKTWKRKGGKSKIVATVRPDRIGRVLIPLEFREFFPDRVIVLVWEKIRVELWNKERWKEHLGEVIATA